MYPAVIIDVDKIKIKQLVVFVVPGLLWVILWVYRTGHDTAAARVLPRGGWYLQPQQAPLMTPISIFKELLA